MNSRDIVLESPHAVLLQHTVKSHGWYFLAPWDWNEGGQMLSRPEMLSSDSRAEIEATQEAPNSVRVTVNAAKLSQDELEAARDLVARWLSTDWDPRPAITAAGRIDADAANAIREGHGRFLRGSTFYEDFAKTVCTIQIAWSGTKRMVTALVDVIGDGVFPTPRDVLDAGEDGLRNDARLGFRAPQLLAATEDLSERGLMDEDGKGAEDRITYEELIELPGIGPDASGHVAMLLRDFIRFPVESAVTRFL